MLVGECVGLPVNQIGPANGCQVAIRGVFPLDCMSPGVRILVFAGLAWGKRGRFASIPDGADGLG